MVHTTGKKSTESAQQLKERRKTWNLNGPNTEKYFRPDPELACRYLEENNVMSLQLRNASSRLTIFTNTFSGNAYEAYEKLEVVFSLWITVNFVKSVKVEMCVLSCAEFKFCLWWFTVENFRKELIDSKWMKKVYWLTNPIKTEDKYTL